MTPSNELRKFVKQNYPHLTISVKEISFQDLARESKFTLKKVSDNVTMPELTVINDVARTLGILPHNKMFYCPEVK